MFDCLKSIYKFSGKCDTVVVKQCPKCKVLKPLIEFYKRKTGNRAGKYYEKCRECMKIRGRAYYHTNRTRQLPLAIARKHKAYEIKRSYISNLKNIPCSDCGNTFPSYVMDFDHREGQKKLANIAHMSVRNWSLTKIQSEIEKCDIVCANCHRIRTFKRAEVAKVVTAGL